MKTIATPSPIAAKKLCADANYGSVSEVSPGIIVVLAENPKDYTGPGTNTYIVGDEQVWIIDPGPSCDQHVCAVMAAVGERAVAGILVTHTHMDHSPGAAPLKQLTGAKTYGFGALSAEVMALTDEEVDVDFVPDLALSDGQTLGDGAWQITALHTPGHFPNHMCYRLENKGMIFSGDHVMGWSTTAIIPPLGNLKEYLEGLDKLARYPTSAMLPSHGPVIESPAKRISDVRDHRMARHKQVEACVRRGVRAPSAIVEEIYTDLTPLLIEAAKGCVEAHLEMLFGDSVHEQPARNDFVPTGAASSFA
ncbi:MAG: MBL fold metallo-hydrolase [Kordiimonadales bacterium]|nr:MAG: MBL fold metallo-hydrolase [Kordiimonadales bacterium]